MFWLAFLAGYLCRSALGDWLISVHTGSWSAQIYWVGVAILRVFTTFVVVIVAVSVCIAIAFFSVGVCQEIWYQIFRRRLLSIFSRQSTHRDHYEDSSSGAPKEPVRALKHSQSVKDDAAVSPQPPSKSLLARIQALESQAHKDSMEELSVKEEDSDMSVTILGSE